MSVCEVESEIGVMVSCSAAIAEMARIVGVNPKTNCENSSTMATERIYLTLILLKISINFRNFADKSAKRLRIRFFLTFARVF